MMIVIESSRQFDEAVRASFVAVALFSDPACRVCKAAMPALADLASGAGKAVAWVQVDANVDELRTREAVDAFPTFDLYRRGNRVLRIRGMEPEALQTALDACLKAKITPLTEDIFVADWQLTRDQLETLAQETGARSILNLRDESEQGYLASGVEEARLAGLEEGADLPLLLASDVTKKYLKRARKIIRQLQKPCLIHCNKGLTAVMVACAFEAKKRNLDSSQVAHWMADLGPYNLSSDANMEKAVKKFLQKKKEKKEKKKSNKK